MTTLKRLHSWPWLTLQIVAANVAIIMALAAAFLAMAYTEPENRMAYWLTLLTALFCAVLAAIVHGALFPNWSAHLMMITAGALSRYIVRGCLGFGEGLIDQLRHLPSRLADRFFGGKDRK